LKNFYFSLIYVQYLMQLYAERHFFSRYHYKMREDLFSFVMFCYIYPKLFRLSQNSAFFYFVLFQIFQMNLIGVTPVSHLSTPQSCLSTPESHPGPCDTGPLPTILLPRRICRFSFMKGRSRILHLSVKKR
jgi:hypothetical protein